MLIPALPPDDETYQHTVTVATDWIPVLIGLLSDNALRPDFWIGTEAEQLQAVEWTRELITMLMFDDIP